ncbi:MAG: hypothetical protein KIT25_03195 [Enhydrobacter sp.]|nr:MAG: hypothetical protein KIT25_03195 [Enhydrobacter sp.]
MPLRWEVDHDQRLVVVTADGLVQLEDVEQYLDAIVIEDAMPYRKIFDATRIVPVATDDDVMLLGARMRAYVATLEGGPLAFVVTTPEARVFVDRYINLTGARRPVRIFSRVEDARAWLRDL